MAPLEVPADYKAEVDNYAAELKNNIVSHQVLFKKLQENPQDVSIQKKLKEYEAKILTIGLQGKKMFVRLRKEYKVCQRNGKKTLVRNCIEEKRTNVNNALGRARKQNIVTRIASAQSSSSEGSPSGISTPEPTERPIIPQELTQEHFLRSCFNLLTHDALQDLQHRRVERKRRSTTNPLYVYTKEWNATTIQANVRTKRKRSSPPNSSGPLRRRTRDLTKRIRSRSVSPVPLPGIPALPSGLTIERVPIPTKRGDLSKCIECSLTGNLQECISCGNGFHVSCHNRILSQTPRKCPRCLQTKENAAQIAEKVNEKKALLEKKQSLSAELTRLQDQHSQLTVSLRTQQTHREELMLNQQSTEDRIKKILDFISSVKSGPPESDSANTPD